MAKVETRVETRSREATAPDEAPSGYTGAEAPIAEGLGAVPQAIERAIRAGVTDAAWSVRLVALPAEPRAEGLEAARHAKRAPEPRTNPNGTARERRAVGPYGLARDQALVVEAEAADGTRTTLTLVCGACRAAFAGEPLAGHTHRLTAP